jgi:uncharacterized damage-inducible protein DinB
LRLKLKPHPDYIEGTPTNPSMRSHRFLLLAALLAPAVTLAQRTTGAAATKKADAGYSAVADVRANWRTLSGYVLQSARDVPEDKYSWKPTPEVRSFAEQFAHVAGAQSMFCAMALGEKPPAEDAVTAKTKGALIAALEKSNKDCERAYAQPDAALGAKVDVFGQQQTRLYALIMNATHDAEHYGNLVTYLRLNGITPASSRR